MTNTPCERVLVVDDDEIFRLRLMRAFLDRGYQVQGAPGATDALAVVQRWTPQWAVLDLRMEGRSGLELLSELIALVPEMRVVVLTGYGSIATALEAVRSGAVHYLTKPADTDRIIAALSGQEYTDPVVDLPVPSLSQVQWDHIQRVMFDCGGNVSHAAKVLGIHRRSLQRKMGKNPGTLQ